MSKALLYDARRASVAGSASRRVCEENKLPCNEAIAVQSDPVDGQIGVPLRHGAVARGRVDRPERKHLARELPRTGVCEYSVVAGGGPRPYVWNAAALFYRAYLVPRAVAHLIITVGSTMCPSTSTP
jgi:hypothetical protein